MHCSLCRTKGCMSGSGEGTLPRTLILGRYRMGVDHKFNGVVSNHLSIHAYPDLTNKNECTTLHISNRLPPNQTITREWHRMAQNGTDYRKTLGETNALTSPSDVVSTIRLGSVHTMRVGVIIGEWNSHKTSTNASLPVQRKCKHSQFAGAQCNLAEHGCTGAPSSVWQMAQSTHA